MKTLLSSHLPSPPTSTPITNNLQFSSTTNSSKRAFQFPSLIINSSSSNVTSPPSSDDTTPLNLDKVVVNFNQSLLSALPPSSNKSNHHKFKFNPKPIPLPRSSSTRLSLSTPTPSSSASSSLSSSSLDLTPCRKKKRGVEFCSTPLASLNASPKHKFQFSLSHLNKRKKSFSSHSEFVYSNRITLGGEGDDQDEEEEEEEEEEAREEEEEGIETNLVSSPAARGHSKEFDFATHSKLERLGEAMEIDGEGITDDEEEEELVEYLLLSQEQLSSSPLRLTPFSLSLPDPSQFFVPKSILKKSNHKIQVVGNAIEGAKRNGGRVKHMVGFGHVELTASGRKVLVPLAGPNSKPTPPQFVDAGPSGSKKGTTLGSGFDTFGSTASIGGDGNKDKENGKGKGREEGGSGSSRDGRRDEEGGGGGGARVVYEIKDDDPELLRAPLLVLRASLQPIAANYIRPQGTSEENLIGVLPRPQANSDSLSSPLGSYMRQGVASPLPLPTSPRTSNIPAEATSPHISSNHIPILLHELETAYVSLTRVLIRLPSTLSAATTTLAPLVQHRSSLLKCLERDISNILNPPIPSSSSTTSRPTSFHNAHGRVLDLQFQGSSSPSSPLGGGVERRLGLTDSEMRRQKDEVGAAQAAIKCVGALLQQSRFFTIFTTAELSSLLSIILKIPTTANLPTVVSKDLFPFIPWLLSVQRLPSTLISHHLPKILLVLQITLTTPDKARSNLAESISAIGILVQTHPEGILMKWKVWFGFVVEGLFEVPKKGIGVRCRSSATLGRVVVALISKWGGVGEKEKRGKVANEISEDFLRILHAPRGGQETSLLVLKGELIKCLVDEAPTAVTIISLFPALLGKRFRKIEANGIRPWIELVSLCRDHTSVHIRNYANLMWHHFVAAFLRSPDVEGLLFTRTRPMNLLTQALNQRAIWGKEGKQYTDRGIILGQVLVGLAYGLTVLVRSSTPSASLRSSPPKVALRDTISSSSSPPKPTSSTPSLPSSFLVQQHDHFDQIWAALVQPLPKVDPSTSILSTEETKGDLVNMITSIHQSVSVLGWQTFAAILAPTSGSPKLDNKEAHLDRLLNVSLLEGNLGRTKSPMEQSTMVQKISDRTVKPDLIPGWGSQWIVERSEKVLKVLEGCWIEGEKNQERTELTAKGFRNVWTNFILAFAAESENDQIDTKLVQLAEWIQSLDQANPLRLDMIAITFEVLGDRVLELTSSVRESSAISLANIFFSTLASSSQELNVSLQKWSHSSQALELLSAVTVELLTRTREDEIYVQLATNWAVMLSQMESEIDESTLEIVVQLLRLPSRGTISPQIFKELARTLSTLIFGRMDTTLSNYFVNLVEPPSDPVEDIKLVTLLLSSVENESRIVQQELLQPALNALAVLLLSPGLQLAEYLDEMLRVSPDSLFPSLYTKVLEGLTSIISQPSSENFLRLAPLLEYSLERTLDLKQSVTRISIEQESMSTDSGTKMAMECLDAIKAFHSFWKQTFDQATEVLPIPIDLMELLRTVKKVSNGWTNPQLEEESQSQSSHETQLPPAAQAIAHLVTPSPIQSSIINDPSGRGYEGDLSATSHGEVFINSSHGLPSPILEVPKGLPQVEKVVEVVEASPELEKEPVSEVPLALPASTIIEETPPEVQHSRSSRRSSAVAQVVSEVVIVKEEPKAVKKKRNRSSSLPASIEAEEKNWNFTKENTIVIDDDSDDAVISTGRRSASQTSDVPPFKKVKRKSVSSRKRERGPEVEEKKRRKSNDGSVSSTSSQASKNLKVSRKKSSRESSFSSSRSVSVEVEVEEEEEPSQESSYNPILGFESEPSPNTRAQTIANFLSLSIEGVVRNAAELGGTQGLNRLIELGKQAKEFFAKSPGGRRERSAVVVADEE